MVCDIKPTACEHLLRAGTAASNVPETIEAGNNMLKYWLRPVSRQGLDAGTIPPSCNYITHPGLCTSVARLKPESSVYT